MSVIRCFQFWRGNILFQCSIDCGTLNKNIMGSRDGAVVEPPTQASHQCGPGSIPGLGVICGLSLLLVLVLARSERFFSGYSGFPFSSKTNISKFQFDLDYCQALYHEPLAREIAQALPVLLTLNKLQLQVRVHECFRFKGVKGRH